jgi:predicted  nucleic acid-binding Zn-ribbon protein
MPELSTLIFGSSSLQDFELPNLVVAIVMIIFVILVKDIWGLYTEQNLVHKSLADATRFLDKFKSEVKSEQFQELNSYFSINHILADQWGEFAETLLIKKDKEALVYNTEQIDSYFTKTSIIDKYIHTSHFESVPGTLTGLGLLGTFVSILIGLYHVHVAASGEVTGVSELINGLSGKFISSIAGLLTAIIFQSYLNGQVRELESLTYDLQHKVNRLFARSIPERTLMRTADNLESLVELFKKKFGLDNSTLTDPAMESLTEQVRALRTDLIDSVDKTNSNVTDQFKNLRSESRDSNSQIISILNDNFDKTNKQLEEAVATLSKGATEEIIKALEGVIRDFNNNLTEQFGENFKELNKAVLNLLEWQENYKSSIIELEKALSTTVQSLSSTDSTLESIANRNKEVITVYEQLKEIIVTYNGQISEIEKRLDDYSQLNVQLQEIATKSQKGFEDAASGFSSTSNSLLKQTQDFIQDNQNQLIVSIQGTYDQLDTLSNKMQGAVTAQSETLANLSKTLPEHSQELNERLSGASEEIERQLTQSLGQMESALTGLTNKFAETYKANLSASQRT